MTFGGALSAWREFAARAANRYPRLIVVLGISLACLLTPAWLPPVRESSSFFELLGDGGYRLRMVLPDAAPWTAGEEGGSGQTGDNLVTIDPNSPNTGLPPNVAGDAHNNAAFADAFRDLIKKPEPKPGEILAVDYNLAELTPVRAEVDHSDGSLTVQKPLFVNGVSAGAATIRIESGAQVLIATSSVAKALGDRADALPRRITNALAKGSGFIPFYELRSAGIQVEYDAARDRVSLSMPS